MHIIPNQQRINNRDWNHDGVLQRREFKTTQAARKMMDSNGDNKLQLAEAVHGLNHQDVFLNTYGKFDVRKPNGEAHATLMDKVKKAFTINISPGIVGH